jgi:hypothetical protein
MARIMPKMQSVVKDITKECELGYLNGEDPVVVYKNVALWYTIYEQRPSEVESTIICLVGNEYDGYTILGYTPMLGTETLFDHSTYGDWKTLEEALAWLDNPVTLY